jgi:uncharacterized protein YbbC (DUF1343 family)
VKQAVFEKNVTAFKLKTQQNITNGWEPGNQTAVMRTGIDQLLPQQAFYTEKRIGLVCNNASLTADGTPTRLALLQNNFRLVKLFSPEHGLDATGEDGKYQRDGIDSLTSLPIISLYGDRMAPREEDLADIDLVLFDIPDVGCRFYTYLWTMTHVMESCAAFNTPLLILDRPNPIGGNLLDAEGPMLDEAHCTSFIGRWQIPIRHCCTLGELALYFAGTKISGLTLQVMPVSNWNRNQTSGIIFTPTSPAIRKRATALLYPGMGLLEGINVNEGRGTDTPFEICGAPWIDSNQLQKYFTDLNNPGIICTTITYTPNAGIYTGEICIGLHFTVTNENIFRPVNTVISLLGAILKCYPMHARERLYCTLANPSGKGHLDKLLGIPDAILKIKSGAQIITAVTNEWALMMKDYLLYD